MITQCCNSRSELKRYGVAGRVAISPGLGDPCPYGYFDRQFSVAYGVMAEPGRETFLRYFTGASLRPL